MKVSLVTRAVGVSVVAAIGLTACGSNNSSGGNGGTASGNQGCASGSLTAEGSTFQQAIEQQWSSQFASKCSGAQITYTGDGSGTGISQFGLGKVDFAGSDVTMATTEQAAADKACGSPALTVPITAGGIAIIYKLKNVPALKLSAATIAGIFEGTIKTWDDKQIAADNSGVQLPPTAIKPYWRNDGSGSSAVLSGFLDTVAHSAWTLGVSKQPVFPVGQGAAGSSGVVSGVKQTEGGITYAEVSYAKQNSLPTAQIKNAAGTFQPLTSATVSQSIDTGFSVTGTGTDLAGALDFTKMTGYPIATVSYALVCSAYSDAAKGKLVKAYFDYAVTDGQTQADALGFAPLPASLATKAKASFDAIA